MIVLDACATAKSDFGLTSLSRGFYLSGAQQIIATQWRSSDRASTNLMSGFYELLAGGASTAKALAESKRSYLQSHSGIHIHPFFWGSHEIWGWSNNKLYRGKSQKYSGIGWAVFLLLSGFLVPDQKRNESYMSEKYDSSNKL